MISLPLVLVHGFLGGSAQWELQRQSLEKDIQLITIDLPGFGTNNQLEAPDTISGFANFVLEYLTEIGVERFNLLGHSMGGMIVQEIVALDPQRINRLILYGTASSGNLPGRFETFETSKQRIREDGVVASARRISATWFLEYEDAAQFENCAKVAMQSSLQAMMAGLDAMETWSREDCLSAISCPVLIVWGEKDRTYHWPQTRKLWTVIPDASLAVLPGCSHAAHLEKPEMFNLSIRDFLK